VRCGGRVARAVLLASAGLLLATATAEARLVQEKKPGEAVERGGQDIMPGRQPPICAAGFVPAIDFLLAVPFTLGTVCFSLHDVEAITRAAAAFRLVLPDRHGAWRAPRLSGRAARWRRIEAGRHRKHFPWAP
jgi:hypothetical protein